MAVIGPGQSDRAYFWSAGLWGRAGLQGPAGALSGLVLAIFGLAACAPQTGSLPPLPETEFRKVAPFLAAPVAYTDPPQSYAAHRLGPSGQAAEARIASVLDDVERAVARLEPASFEAERIALSDRTRIALVAGALGEGRRLRMEAQILERADANRRAMDAAVASALTWHQAYRLAAADVAVLDQTLVGPLGREGAGGYVRLQEALERYHTALRRLSKARLSLTSALDALPSARERWRQTGVSL